MNVNPYRSMICKGFFIVVDVFLIPSDYFLRSLILQYFQCGNLGVLTLFINTSVFGEAFIGN